MKTGVKNKIVNVVLSILVIAFIIFVNFKNDLKTKKYEESLIYDFTDDTSFASNIYSKDSSYIIFCVSDEYGKRGEGVGIEIYNTSYESIGITYTNSEGKAGFGGLKNQNYVIRVISTPSQYENVSDEYIIKKEDESEAFKKNIKIKRGEKKDIKNYKIENIIPFKKRNIWCYEGNESSSLKLQENELVNSKKYDEITYSTLIYDKFEGMQVETMFSSKDGTYDYKYIKEVNLKINGAKIISYSVSFDDENVKVLNNDNVENTQFSGNSNCYIASNEKLEGKNCYFIIIIEKNSKKYKMKLKQEIPNMQ